VLSQNDLIKGAKLPPDSRTNLSNYIAVIRQWIGYMASITNRHGKGWMLAEMVEVLLDEDAIPPAWALISPQIKPAANPSPLIGREADLIALETLVGNHRLVALVGPGGVGKTRLAAELVRRVAAKFQNGAVLVELASLHDANAVASALAQALKLPLQTAAGVPIENIADAIADRRSEITFDNCEHIGGIVVDTVRVLKARAQEEAVAAGQPAESAKPDPKAQYNFTDPESRIMKTSDGSFHQCFNGQGSSTQKRR